MKHRFATEHERRSRSGPRSGFYELQLGILLLSISSCLVDVEEGAKNSPKGDASAGQNGGDKGATENGDNSDLNPESKNKDGASSGKDKSTKCKSGKSRECLETPDGEIIHYPGGVILSPCKPGRQKCIDGHWGRCEGAVAPKKKDTCDKGNDDNCNGRPNDHCACTPGETQKCGNGTGECSKGELLCDENGRWGKDCVGEVTPQKEICDGKDRDEDCDGVADLKDEDCSCLDAPVIDCAIEGEKGDCSQGKGKCVGGKIVECEPRFSPEVEICGKRSYRDRRLSEPTGDEDCDGLVDESDEDNQYMPKGGKKHMRDDDGDDYGAMMGDDILRLYCDGAYVPRHFIPYNKDKMTDCGDCKEQNGSGVATGWFVRPDVEYCRTKPSVCLQKIGWRGGPYDYDCDGKATGSVWGGNDDGSNTEPEKVQVSLDLRVQCIVKGNGCASTKGWLYPPARCGETNTWMFDRGCYKDSNDRCVLNYDLYPEDTVCCR